MRSGARNLTRSSASTAQGRRRDFSFTSGSPRSRALDRRRGLWTDDEGKENLRFYLDIAHRENNQTLHVSARSLAQVVHAKGPEGISFKLGPSLGFVDRALVGSFWIFLQTLTLLLDEFSFERDRDKEAEVFSVAPFRKLTAPELKGVGRNDPCPCGSGQKYKRCHGA